MGRGFRGPDVGRGPAKPAETQDGVKTAATAAQAAFEGLATAAQIPRLSEHVAAIEASRPKVDALFDFTIVGGLTHRRGLPRELRVEVQVGHVHGKLGHHVVEGVVIPRNHVSQRPDPEVVAIDNRSASPSARLAALERAEAAHAAFLDFVPRSLPGKLMAVADAHSGLAERLKRQPDKDEVLKFLISLKTLSETLTEDDEEGTDG